MKFVPTAAALLISTAANTIETATREISRKEL
jgi:hypothetical protein